MTSSKTVMSTDYTYTGVIAMAIMTLDTGFTSFFVQGLLRLKYLSEFCHHRHLNFAIY